jgi:hypothetical protein
MTDGADALTAEVVSGCFSSAASQELRQTRDKRAMRCADSAGGAFLSSDARGKSGFGTKRTFNRSHCEVWRPKSGHAYQRMEWEWYY